MYILNGNQTTKQRLIPSDQQSTEVDIESVSDKTSTNGTIILIEPRYLLRECLAKGLEESSGCRVVSYATVEEWITISLSRPTAVLILSAGGRGRREVLADFDALAKAGNQLPIVLLAQHEGIDCIIEMLSKGARAYVPMSLSIGVAVEAIRLVKAGGTFVPASCLVAAQAPLEPEPLAFHVGETIFTHRQAAVIEALRSGKANKIIAYELSMQESTVKVHVRNIMRKLNAKNRTEVAVIINAFKQERHASPASSWSNDANAI